MFLGIRQNWLTFCLKHEAGLSHHHCRFPHLSIPLLSRTLELRGTKNSPSLLIFPIVACSLTPDTITTLIHSFITAQLDYCCLLYVDLPAGWLGCLDEVCVLTHTSPKALPKMVMSLAICWICSTGTPSNRASRIESLLWSGGHCCGSSHSPLYWARRAHHAFGPHSNYAE